MAQYHSVADIISEAVRIYFCSMAYHFDVENDDILH